MNNVIALREVSKTYGKGDGAVRALSDISLHVDEGEFIAILGASGSGKSTLMNIVGLMDTADSGQYLLDGQDIMKSHDASLTRLRGRKIGFIFQKYNLIAKYSVLYNVALPLLLAGKSYGQAKQDAAATLERVGLGDKLKRKPAELSGGQAQRVAIARALVTNPTLLLADEPTGALDKKTGEDVLGFMQELHSGAGKTIIMITHDQHVASKAQRIVQLEDGRITGDH
ncbi:MAG: ABC transporter ATP-binding protein [Oscillospiraceae bacterium]|jgi:putative ABC transport system ATP-binding protein|nr:ABC transporter ATP-binding protein [Oscillospiraceae bacterium]